MHGSYYRPVAQTGVAPIDALPLSGGWCWFTHVEILSRSGSRGLIAAKDIPEKMRDTLTCPRANMVGLSFCKPTIMGILNLTPDSFSDGGRFTIAEIVLQRARALLEGGADILDIGGESTRPGSLEIPVGEEIARTVPVVASLRAQGFSAPISIDTRKADVARATLAAGADLVNAVSAMEFDSGMAAAAAEVGAPICLMHAQGLPETMQDDPRYGNVLLDVYDYLEERIVVAEAAGIPRSRILVDPGVGFGKSVHHNLALIRGLSLSHSLGCAILLGVSRKRFIGAVGKAPEVSSRAPGTLAVTLA